MDTPLVKRRSDGTLLPGQGSLNPGGRPRSALSEVQEALAEHSEELVDRLLALTQSEDEAIRLAALKEAFDRLVGRAQLSVSTTSTRHVEQDIRALYLVATQDANKRAALEAHAEPVADDHSMNGANEW